VSRDSSRVTVDMPLSLCQVSGWYQ